MRNLIIITFLLILTIDKSYSYDPSNSYKRLRKLSLKLKGKNPSPDEYNSLAKVITEEQIEDFFILKTKNYLNSKEHLYKMEIRMEELFRLRVRRKVDLKNTIMVKTASDYKDTHSDNTLNYLFRRIIKKNLSWSNLLSTDFYTYSSVNQDFFKDSLFYNAIENTGHHQDKQKIHITKRLKDLTAGAITTSRFFERYPTTHLNKNRKRAAALFRVFLCDDMKPVILPSKKEDNELLNIALGINASKTITHDQAVQEKRHGSDPVCMSCHYKLDPMGKTFRTSSFKLSPFTSPGALSYKDDSGRLINTPVSSIGELALEIFKQPQYKQCQVKHFWNWFIGKDIVLDKETLSSLTKTFTDLEQRPNDFIAHLVNTKSFYSLNENKTNETVNLNHVKPILRKCSQCHTALSIPDFYQLPIESSAKHLEWVTKITKRLDLNNDGKNATMPPSNANWKLTKIERNLIKRWIKNGARDDKNNRTLTQDESNLIITSKTQVNIKKLTATFHDTFYKYLENHDIFQAFDQYFGNEYVYIEKCFKVTDFNINTLGFKKPQDGKPLFLAATPSYIKLIQECSTMYLKYLNSIIQNEQALKGNFRFINPKIIQALGAYNRSSALIMNWRYQSPQAKDMMIEFILNQLLPFQIYGRAHNDKIKKQILEVVNLYVEAPESQANVLYIENILTLVTISIILTEEFLTY